jgi:hypothetical protein
MNSSGRSYATHRHKFKRRKVMTKLRDVENEEDGVSDEQMTIPLSKRQCFAFIREDTVHTSHSSDNKVKVTLHIIAFNC